MSIFQVYAVLPLPLVGVNCKQAGQPGLTRALSTELNRNTVEANRSAVKTNRNTIQANHNAIQAGMMEKTRHGVPGLGCRGVGLPAGSWVAGLGLDCRVPESVENRGCRGLW